MQALANLEENLAEYHVKLDTTPYVLQMNKRDLTDIAPVWYLDYLLNTRHVPSIEAVACDGEGVLDTLNTLCRYVLRDLVNRFETGAF